MCSCIPPLWKVKNKTYGRHTNTEFCITVTGRGVRTKGEDPESGIYELWSNLIDRPIDRPTVWRDFATLYYYTVKIQAKVRFNASSVVSYSKQVCVKCKTLKKAGSFARTATVLHIALDIREQPRQNHHRISFLDEDDVEDCWDASVTTVRHLEVEKYPLPCRIKRSNHRNERRQASPTNLD